MDDEVGFPGVSGRGTPLRGPDEEWLLQFDEFAVRLTQTAIAGPAWTPAVWRPLAARYFELAMALPSNLPADLRQDHEVPARTAAPGALELDGIASRLGGFLGLIRLRRRRLRERFLSRGEERRIPHPPLLAKRELAGRPGAYPLVAEIVRHLERAAGDLAGAVLHGSFASFEAVPFSDLDLLVVCRTGVVDDPQAFRRVRGALLRLGPILAAIDPLSHHGVQVLSEDDLLWHPEPRFPLFLFGRGRSLLHRERPYRVRLLARDRPERRRRLLGIVAALRDRFPANSRGVDAATAKDWVSRLLLVPALALQAAGVPSPKKESFELARARWPGLDWSVVDVASRLRLAWRPPPALLRPFSPSVLGALPVRVAAFATRLARRVARDRGRAPILADPAAFAARVRDFARSLEDLLSSTVGDDEVG